MVIRRINVWSAARMYGAISAAVGVIAGFVIALLSTVGAGLGGPGDDIPGWFAGVFGIGAIIVLPVFYGVMGIIGGAIGAVLYNVFAGMVGGIEIETGN
jgi:hypothetical protein